MRSRHAQAAKLRFGTLKLIHSTFENLQVLHINAHNVVATLLADADANAGVMISFAPQLVKALASLNHGVARARVE